MKKTIDGRPLPATVSGSKPGDFPLGSLESRAAARALLGTTKVEESCICFPPDDPPLLELRAEREAAKSVLCPLHGVRFSKFAPYVWRPQGRPTHLEPQHWSWHTEQYIKAMKTSFPPDRWPAEEVTDPDGTIRYVLKDGTEIHRIELQPVHDYATGLPIFENGKQLKAGPRGKLGFWEPSQIPGDADPWQQGLSAAYRSWNYTVDPEYEINEGNAAKVLAKLHPMLNTSSGAEQDESHLPQAAHSPSSSDSEVGVTIEPGRGLQHGRG